MKEQAISLLFLVLMYFVLKAISLLLELLTTTALFRQRNKLAVIARNSWE